MTTTRAVYAAFDQYPSFKGAATHIFHMIDALAGCFGRVKVFTLGPGSPEAGWEFPAVEHVQFNELIPNYLSRAQRYSTWLEEQLSGTLDVELAHFRDIWSGMAVLNSRKAIETVFEVNGLPSIELPFRYPYISASTLDKIREIEQHCLMSADHLICPSSIIKRKLIEYGVQPSHIEVISNGADLQPHLPKPEGLPGNYILYSGALQAWQGVDILIKAMNYLRDLHDLYLVICSSQGEKFAREYRKMAERLGIDHRIVWFYQLDRNQLYPIIRHARLTVAPLKENNRNIIQGCSPIKIFESFAAGTAVVASDIPAVREIIENNKTGKLVRPGRPAELARVIRFLVDYPEFRDELAENGRRHLAEHFQWKDIKRRLVEFYREIISEYMY